MQDVSLILDLIKIAFLKAEKLVRQNKKYKHYSIHSYLTIHNMIGETEYYKTNYFWVDMTWLDEKDNLIITDSYNKLNPIVLHYNNNTILEYKFKDALITLSFFIENFYNLTFFSEKGYVANAPRIKIDNSSFQLSLINFILKWGVQI